METVSDFIFLGSKITADGDCSHEIKRCLLLGRKFLTNLDSISKSRDITFPAKVYIVKAICFPSSHVWIWELDHKEGWVPKNWCFPTMMLEETLKNSLDCKEIKPVNPKGNQSWVFKENKSWIFIQGTLKSPLQHHSSKTSILWCSAFFIVQLSHPCMTIGKTTALTI